MSAEIKVLGLETTPSFVKKPREEITSDISVGSSDYETKVDTPEEAVLLVDPWSTGNTVWTELENQGYRVVVVWEKGVIRSQRASSDMLLHTDLEESLFLIKEVMKLKYDFIGVIAGSETAVPLAESLANSLHLPTHPPTKAVARRNKYLMGESLRQAGVRAVKQKITTDLTSAVKFVQSELLPSSEAFSVIVKPNMGAGSDDVYLCKSMEDFEDKFNLVNGKINSLGLKNDGVLVQEYLNGTEYVVDSVSTEGKHQICAIWQYDKREANGRFNVYHGTFPVANNSELSQKLIAYVYQVLNALEFRNGPAHAEIKMTPSGPCLVEIGARCHGGAGSWLELANACFGMNQVKGVVQNLRQEPLPMFPTELKHFGAIADMVYYEEGTITAIPGRELLEQLESVKEVVFYNKIGDRVKKTVDCNTQPGHIVLLHEDESVIRRDYNKIHEFFRLKQVFNIE